MKNSSGSYYAMSNDKGTSAAPSAINVTVSGDKLSSEPESKLLWNIFNSSGNLTIYPNGTTAKWLYCNSDNNGVRVGTNSNKTFTIDASSGYLKHTGTSRYVGVYNNADWRCYTSVNTNIKGQTLTFFVQSAGKTETAYYTCIEHDWQEATCQSAKTCTVCGFAEGDLGDHNYVDGTCSVCGDEKPTEPSTVEATLSFADVNNRTFFSTSQQVWEQNGVTLINDKASATSNVADYVNPVRFYKNSKLTISAPGKITKIVFTCGSSNYATALKTAIGSAATVSGSTVTVEFSTPVDSYEITSLSGGQVQMNSITVTYLSTN